MQQDADPFREFIKSLLEDTVPEKFLVQLLAEGPMNNYFRKAFTSKTFREDIEYEKFNYEVLEKVGDKILGSAFQQWLYGILGEQTTSLQAYSDIEKRFVGTIFLSELADKLDFGKWIKAAPGNPITNEMKEDVFEAFVGALTLAADQYIVKGFGTVLANTWIFQVYDTYAKDRVDAKNTYKYQDQVSRLNEVWQFNGWGTPFFITLANSEAAREANVGSFASVDIRGPDIKTFPERFRGKILGSGVGKNLTEAKANAAEETLKSLAISYAELKQFEVQFDRLDMARIEKALVNYPELLQRLKDLLDKNSLIYEKISIKTAKINGRFTTQLRARIDGVFKSISRGRGDSKAESIVAAIRIFLDQDSRGAIRLN